MELYKAIKERRSIRRFQPTPVPQELIKKILEFAMWAPSGMNQQNWYFVVVTGEKLQELKKICKQAFDRYTEKTLSLVFKDNPKVIEYTRRFFYTLGDAPVVICAYRIQTLEGDLTDIQSVAAAIQNLLLAAHTEGLGTCWMTGPTHLEDEINKLFGIKDKKLQALITIGYPLFTPRAPERKGGKVEWIGFEGGR